MNPPEGEEKPKTEETPPASASNAPASGEPSPAEGSLEANEGKASAAKPEDNSAPKSASGIKKIIRKFDVYFLLFLFIVVVSLIIAYVAVQKNKTAKQVQVANQTLDQSALTQVNSNDTQVGGTNQTLDVQSDTVFAGNVLVKNSLQVAGSLKVAGTLSLPGITVSGTTDLGQVNAATLTLTGDATVKGALTVDQGLSVNGIASFSGALNANAISVSTLQVNGDFTYQSHVYTTGGIPSDSPTNNIGSGGTSTVNGTDTAGEVNINTANGASKGCLVNIKFTKAYTILPYIVISPVGPNVGNMEYYINKTETGFSICSANTPPSPVPMSFDYEIIG